MGKKNQKKATLHEFKIGEYNIRVSKTRIDIQNTSESIKYSYELSMKATGITPFTEMSVRLEQYLLGNFDERDLRLLIQSPMNVLSLITVADAEFVIDIIQASKRFDDRLIARVIPVTDEEDKEIIEEERIKQQHKEMVAEGEEE